MSVELPPTIEGTVLNYRYQVEHVFNDKGGMGLIYRATDMNLRSTVVLKKSRFVDEQSRSAFEREARLLYGLRHNALPRVIDYFITEDNSQFFVMEFIPGQDLSEMLSDRIERGEGPFPVNQVMEWGDQLLDALHYLHMHTPPIIHRDIKPQNLKLMPNGQVILLDFGLAKGAVSGMTLGSASIQGYTPNYAPLEQMRGSGTDARSDIYSLAVTMHCLLSGQMPPDAVSRAIETLSAQPDPLRPLHEINPNFPLPVSEALQKACSLNQNERPATAEAMRGIMRKARVKLSRVDSQILADLSFGTSPAPQPKSATTNNSALLNNAPNVEPASVLPADPPASPLEAVKSGRSQYTPQPSVRPMTAPSIKTPSPTPEVPQPSGAPAAERQQPKANGTVAAQPATPVIAALSEPPGVMAPPAAPIENTGPNTGANTGPNTVFDTLVDFQPEALAQQLYDTVIGLPAEESAPQQNFDTMVGYVPEEKPAPESPHGQPAPLAMADAPAPAVASAAPPADPLRQTSLFVIEHKDDGKSPYDSEANFAALRQEFLAPTVARTPAAKPLLTRQQPANGAGPAPERRLPAHPPARRPFDEQPAALRHQPSVHEVEKPSQGDVLPNIDLTGVIANPNTAAATPKGMRSYTEIVAPNVRMEMHAIPGGEFLMGSPDKRGYADEYPQHRVTLSPFYIGKYPVTQAQWRAVMRTSPSHFTGPNHPVDSITWDEAVEFCRRLSYATSRVYRLPSEAEWEFACRAGMPTQYNYGDEEEFLVQYAWCLTNSVNHTHPVGEKKPNGWGLYDMHGNVWEWCYDWYAADYYPQSPSVNPLGPAKGSSRVLRGGSWYSLPNYCRSAGRSNHQPDLRDPLVGFRVVCEARSA